MFKKFMNTVQKAVKKVVKVATAIASQESKAMKLIKTVTLAVSIGLEIASEIRVAMA